MKKIHIKNLSAYLASGLTLVILIVAFLWFGFHVTDVLTKTTQQYGLTIPKETIDAISEDISMYLIFVELAVAFGFIALTFAVAHLIKKNQDMEKSNERYKLVTTQTQAIVFEYDFLKKRLELSGNLESFFEEEVSVLTGERVLDAINIIHPDDRTIKEEIKNLSRNNLTSISGELRLMCLDEKYYWFKIKSTVVRDESGRALKFVGNFLNVEENLNGEKLLKQRAEIDALTGLLNKEAFEKNVAEYLAHTMPDELYALYVLDIDNFKSVNDILGHQAGNKILSDVAKKMCLVFSDIDCVARKGADEFMVFLKLSPEGRKYGMRIIENKARMLCNKLNDSYSDDRNEVHISASIGVALFPTDGTNFEELYSKADAALYAAKNSGKNQYYMFRENTIL